MQGELRLGVMAAVGGSYGGQADCFGGGTENSGAG